MTPLQSMTVMDVAKYLNNGNPSPRANDAILRKIRSGELKAWKMGNGYRTTLALVKRAYGIPLEA